MPQTVNKRLIETRFRRRLRDYGRHAKVQTDMAERLLADVVRLRGRRFARVLEIGCGAGTLTRLIVEALEIRDFYANDLVEECRSVVEKETRRAGLATCEFLGGDIEGDLHLPSRLDLIISNATFQWIADPGTLLPRLAERLGPGGVLAFSTFGPENLREIRDVTGTGLCYPSSPTIESLLPSGLRLLHRWERRTVLGFASPLEVLKHLRGLGANAVKQETWPRSALARFATVYRERWGVGEWVPLTYHPMIIVAEKC